MQKKIENTKKDRRHFKVERINKIKRQEFDKLN